MARPKACFCGCELEAPEPLMAAVTKARPRTFRFAMPYGVYSWYTYKGMTNAQMIAAIRSAMADLSKVSGAKFVEERKTSKADIKIYFTTAMTAGAQYVGSGNIWCNANRKVTPVIAKAWIQHETMHFLGYRASPAHDNFGHSTIKTEVYHWAGSGTVLGAHFTNWMRARYGAK